MVLPPTLQRHDFAQSIHATFLYPTARLPPLFDAVVVCRCSGGDYRWVVCCKKKRNIHTEDTTSGAPRNHTNGPPVEAHV